MTTISAWQYITEHWYCKDWQPLTNDVKKVLRLDSRIGITGGMLVTYTGAKGIINFVKRMNNKK